MLPSFSVPQMFLLQTERVSIPGTNIQPDLISVEKYLFPMVSAAASALHVRKICEGIPKLEGSLPQNKHFCSLQYGWALKWERQEKDFNKGISVASGLCVRNNVHSTRLSI